MARHPVKGPDWIDSAPMAFSNSIDIATPPAAVWAHIADHAGWTAWFTALDAVEVTGAATGVGGNRRVTVKRLPIDEEFTAWDENERFAFALIATKFPFLHAMAEDVQISLTDSGCNVTYRQGIEARRGFGWLTKLAFGSLDKQTADALSRLKRLCEGGN